MATSFDKETRLPEPPKSKEREMVMLEVPVLRMDTSSEHKGEFFDFLRSLGYAIKPNPHTANFEIDGVEFLGDFSQAATYGIKSYSRQRVPRQIRKITVKHKWSSDENLFTVTINKPMDKLRLVNKINEAVTARKEQIEKVASKVAARKNNALALANKYRVVSGFKSIRLNKDVIELCTVHGYIYFNRAGKVTGILVTFPTVTRIADLHKLSIEALEVNEAMTIAKNLIQSLGHTGIEGGAEDTPRAYLTDGKIEVI
jgi:hypothetical protein